MAEAGVTASLMALLNGTVAQGSARAGVAMTEEAAARCRNLSSDGSLQAGRGEPHTARAPQIAVLCVLCLTVLFGIFCLGCNLLMRSESIISLLAVDEEEQEERGRTPCKAAEITMRSS